MSYTTNITHLEKQTRVGMPCAQQLMPLMPNIVHTAAHNTNFELY